MRPNARDSKVDAPDPDNGGLDDGEFVQRLAAYDERLRRGEAPDAPAHSASDAAPGLTTYSLHDCLHLLERAWPRGALANQAEIPSRIGRFHLERVLGMGGFGIVYLATDPTLHRKVALKVPRLHSLANARLRDRFKREARAAAALDHPNIVPIHETGEEGPVCYIASAYCPGPNVAEWLKSQMLPVPVRLAAALVKTLAEAVEYSHSQGVVHRDLKPSNVLLAPRDTDKGASSNDALPFVPRLTDFGMAKLLGEDFELTAATAIAGTPAYMAPEQTGGSADKIGPATDVYGLGVILYELLTSRPPFQGEGIAEVFDLVREQQPVPPRLLNRSVPRDLETICLKCLEKLPARRFGTAAELADDLERYLRGDAILSRPVGALERAVRWSRQHRAAAALMFVVVAAMAIGIAGLFHHARTQSELNTQLIDAVAKATTAQQTAEGHERRTADALYAADVRNAPEMLKRHDTRTLMALLDRHIPVVESSLDRRGFEWYYLRRQANAESQTLLEAGVPQYFVCYSPDHRLIAAAGADDIVRVFDAASGRTAREIATNQVEVNGLAFSPDGNELATAGDDGSLRTWSVATGEARLAIPGAVREKAFQAVFIPGRGLLACCGEDEDVHLFDAQTGESRGSLVGHSRTVQSLAVGSDGKTLVSASSDGCAILWNLETRTKGGMLVARQRLGPIVVDVPRNLIVTGAADGALQTWRLSDQSPLSKRAHHDDVQAVAVHPTENLLAAGDKSGSIRIWKIDAEGRIVDDDPRSWQAHRGSVSSIAWSGGGEYLLSAGHEGRVVRWHWSGDARPTRIETLGRGIAEIALIPETTRFVGAGGGGLQLFDWCKNPTAVTISDRFLTMVDIPAAGGRLFAWGIDGGLFTWDLANWEPMLQASIPGPQNGCAVSRDGKLIAVSRHSARVDGNEAKRSVCLYQASTGNRVDEIPASTCSHLAFAPDGWRLAIVQDSGWLGVRDVRNQELLWRVEQTAIHALDFSSDGKWLAAAGGDRDVIVRNSWSGSVLCRLIGHQSPITSVAFSPDGRTLATGAKDGSIKLWHLATGQELLELYPGAETCMKVQFTSDGKHLIALIGYKLVLVFHAE